MGLACIIQSKGWVRSMRSNRKGIWIPVFAFLWIIGILGGYYLYHKPFDSTFALVLISGLWNLVVAVIVLSLAGGIGRRVLRVNGIPPGEQAFLQLCLGIGMTSLVILLFGTLTHYLKILIWGGSLVTAVVFWKSIRDWWKDLFSFRLLFGKADSGIQWIMLLISGLLLIAGLTASAPPIQYDALTYHLALPQLYLQQNHIPALTEWVRSGMPQTGEMLYTWAMALAGGSASALTGWLVGVISILALVSFATRIISQSTGWVGAASLLAGSSIVAALGWAYIDWFCLAFGLAAILNWVHFRETEKFIDLLFVGIFCGLAFATKYTGGIILIGMGVLVLIRSTHKIKSLGWLLLGFLISAIPWLIKNMVFTGNPFAPFEFGSGSSGNFIQNLSPFGNLLDVFLLPVRATLVGIEGGVGYSHTIGPLLLIFGIFFWLTRGPNGKTQTLIKDFAIIGVVSIVIWIIGNQYNGQLIQSRMYYVVFPVFAILAGAGYDGLAKQVVPGVRIRVILDIVVILVLGLTLVQSTRTMIQQNILGVVSGVQDRDAYLDGNLGWYAPATRQIQAGDSSTLLIYEPRGFYCSPNCFPDEELGRWSTDYHRLGSCESVISDWQRKGYRQVLVNVAGVEFFLDGQDPNHTPSDLSALQKCIATLPVKQDYGGVYRLFGLTD